MSLAEKLAHALPGCRIEIDLPLAPLTTYQVGGPADLAVFPRTPEELATAVRRLSEEKVPCTVLGRGSNVLISDHGLRGVVLFLLDLTRLEVAGTIITVGAGNDCTEVAACALEAGLTGLEFFHCLPGSVGGAAFMNARAFDQEMSQVWRAARVVTPAGELVQQTYTSDDFSYKRSPLQGSSDLAAELELHLEPGDAQAIRERMESNEAKRRENGEMDHPSCGCVFKNDYSFGTPSGRLIDLCGLKGYRVGDACVGPRHANFVMNMGQATARDLRAVMEHVRDTVQREHGFLMDFEVRFLGEF